MFMHIVLAKVNGWNDLVDESTYLPLMLMPQQVNEKKQNGAKRFFCAVYDDHLQH